ncbi:MAG: preprotein translocase subunit SecY [Planctomycetes bacterium]|nr:preprotein translocase subunit SecY [Planctomycetota bacterium]MCC7169155.1 preprotein translocase subunit SecY [Planctomycetota bacterium]
MTSGFLNIFRIPELRRKLWVTIGLLAVYRLGFHIPVPGANYEGIRDAVGDQNFVFGIMNSLTGGALGNFVVFALGVMPYISASIIFSMLTKVVPALEALQKEGAVGVKKINQYTRWATIPICIVQSLFVIHGMMIPAARANMTIVDPDLIGGGFAQFGWEMSLILTFTCGTLFMMWLGEQITENGIGNGISLIIMAGIVADYPTQYSRLHKVLEPNERWQMLITLMVLFLIIVLGIVYVTKGQRRIPVTHAKHVKGRRVYGPQKSYLPLRINQANVMPIIFANALMVVPHALAQVPGLGWLDQTFRWGSFWWVLTESALIFFFSFFWTALIFQPNEIANNLKEYGGFVPGLRPGKRTAEELERIMVRITLVGAAFLAVLSLLPLLVTARIPELPANLAANLGSTSILITVGVALDLVDKVNAHVVMRNYDGFMGPGSGSGSWTRGRRG